MILGNPSREASSGTRVRATLDQLFRRAAERRPDAPALVDPPDRADFTDGPPRRLSYRDADRMISAVARRLRDMGLHTDTVIGLQLPNTVESVVTLLGVLRAGMIAAPLPVLWRRAELAEALGRIGARALITAGRIGAVDHSTIATHVAAEIFGMRYVCAFGRDLADGVVSFEDLHAVELPNDVAPIERARLGHPAAHVAVVTWDATADGFVPVARSHMQLIAGGLPILLESRLPQDSAIATTVTQCSFGGLASSLVPWLLTGGTLMLQQPFNPDALSEQLRAEACQAVVLPGPVIDDPGTAALLASAEELRAVLALWRGPRRAVPLPPDAQPRAALVDLHVFGEAGLLALRRDDSGRPQPIHAGPVTAPRGAEGAVLVGECMATEAGTLALAGAMVPLHAFGAAGERGRVDYFAGTESGFLDTGYAVQVDPASHTLTVAGYPAGTVGVGGYRFAARRLEQAVARADAGATIGCTADPLTGQRLLGSVANAPVLQQALDESGLCPLIAAAFAETFEHPAASAA